MVDTKTLRERAIFVWRTAAANPDVYSDSHNHTAKLLQEAAEEIEKLRGITQDDDKIIMLASELANYVEGYLKDLAGDYPDEAAKIFEHIFTSATVVVEIDGTFTVDMDGKTS